MLLCAVTAVDLVILPYVRDCHGCWPSLKRLPRLGQLWIWSFSPGAGLSETLAKSTRAAEALVSTICCCVLRQLCIWSFFPRCGTVREAGQVYKGC